MEQKMALHFHGEQCKVVWEPLEEGVEGVVAITGKNTHTVWWEFFCIIVRRHEAEIAPMDFGDVDP